MFSASLLMRIDETIFGIERVVFSRVNIGGFLLNFGRRGRNDGRK